MKGEKHFIYNGKTFPDPGIHPVPYKPEFFQDELDLESELFYEIRKSSNIHPHRLTESDRKQLEEIRSYFLKNSDTFYFLYDQGRLIGSILFVGNYIQSLAIAKSYQRKGLGTKLSIFAINKIFLNGHDSVELNTLPGNIGAEKLYRKIGFKEIND
jgi:ribosomal protein S18 acetylase RimI-like enzyme